MKKYVICLGLLSSILVNVCAQKLVVKDICELTSDITARTKVQLDKDGKECALVRVNIPSIRNVDFKGDIVSSNYLPGEYVLYIPEGTKSVAYSFDGYSGEIDFSLFGIDVRGKNSYRCTMKKDTGNSKCNLLILSEPESAIVVVDGIPKGETPLLIDDITIGEHVISVPNTTGYSMADMRVDVKEGEKQTINLKLVKSEIKGFELETVMYGGDTAGSHWSMYKTIEKNGKCGLVDLLGNIVVPCKYDEVFPEMQNGFFVVWENQKCGLFKPGEGLVVPIQYSGITTKTSDNIIDRFLCVSKRINGDEKFGYIDCTTGKEIISCQLYRASPFPVENFLLIATRYDSYGYLKIEDGKMKVFIEPQLKRASNFENGIALVKIKQQGRDVEAIIDTLGNVKVLPSYYSHPYNCDIGFSEGLCSVYKNGKIGFIDKEGKEVIPCIYNGVDDDFRKGGAILDGLSPDGIKRGRIFISNKGEVYGNQDNIEFESHEQDFYVFIQNGKKGVVRRNGESVLPAKYQECKILRDGWDGEYTEYFAAYETGICDLYDGRGMKIFSCPESLDIIGYKDGFIMIKDPETSTYGYANLKGDIVASCIYTLSEDLGYMMNTTLATINEGLAMLILGDKYGFIDNTGKVVVPVKYSAAIPFMNGIGHVREGNKWIRIQKNKLLKK